MLNNSEKIVGSLQVKKMREEVQEFASMVQEILHIFKDIKIIEIQKVNIPEDNNNNFIILKSSYTYLEISIDSITPFEKHEAIVDLLQSALKESGIVSNDGINTTLKSFLTGSKIMRVNNMVGSTKEKFLKSFDNFIQSTNNHELTFAQKLNNFKK